MDSVCIRTALPQDAEKLSGLINTAFRAERFFTAGDRTNAEKIRDLLRKGVFFILEDAGAMVACVYTEIRGEGGYFGLLAVDPTRQKTGLGAKMIALAEQHCKAAGCRFMDLTIVNLRTELPAYYWKLGYIESGILPFPADQHSNQPCHLVRMTKPLI